MSTSYREDQQAPAAPGAAPVGDTSAGGRGATAEVEAAFDAATFAADAAPPTLPAAWQPIADWLSQPPAAFGGATNGVHCFLNHRDGIGYQGMMFYKPAAPPFHHFSRNRFYCTGFLYPTVPWGELYKQVGSLGNLPAPWVRLVIALRANGGLAGLNFYQSGGSGALPGPEVGWAEEDIADPLGSGQHYVTNLGPWVLYMELTSALI